MQPSSPSPSPASSSTSSVCSTCYNRRWITKAWEDLDAGVTFANVDEIFKTDRKRLMRPCPECNTGPNTLDYGEFPGDVYADWFFARIQGAGEGTLRVTNPAFFETNLRGRLKTLPKDPP